MIITQAGKRSAEPSIDGINFIPRVAGIAVEPGLFVGRIINALNMHRRPGGGFDWDSGFGFKLPSPFAADDYAVAADNI